MPLIVAAAIVLPAIALLAALLVALRSIHRIGPTQVGLVTKRFGVRKLSEDNPIAFRGEAGYQANLLMPGARYRPEFGNFTDLRTFLTNGGEKGVQRPVLTPGSLVPIHPVAFLVITSREVFGLPVAPELVAVSRHGKPTPESFGLSESQLKVLVIAPQGDRDVVGLITALEGEPLASGDIASRLGGFADVAELEATSDTTDAEIIDVLLGSKNVLHNNYQDFQAFLDAGGRIGLQHDPLLYGAYLLNPFLVRVELVPMLVVSQGQVAVIKAFVGLPTLDTSGAEFKFGSIVRPGHRGVPGAQPGRPAGVDRGQEPRGVRVHHRPAGADPRLRHPRAQSDFDGRHDAEPGQRGAAVGRGQPLPQHPAGPGGGAVHRDPPGGPAGGVHRDHPLPVRLRGGDQGGVHPGRGVPAGDGRRADPPRDRQPAAGDVRGAAPR